MKQILLIGFFFTFLSGFAQVDEKITFLDYNTIKQGIYNKIPPENLKTKWDFFFFLVLDSSEIKKVKAISPEAVKEFRTAYHFSPKQDREHKLISMNVKNIQECFLNNNLLKIILDNSPFVNETGKKHLSSPIYIKDNKIAIFTYYGHMWSECDKISITDKGLLIELIYKTIDD